MRIIQSQNFVRSPLTSVIIPSYNRISTVGETIDSILQQQCNFDIEILIGDDCSSDHVRELLQDYQEKYPRNIRLLFHEQNIGLGANWAVCVKHCRGKYIAGCDNDDFWHNPHKLQAQIDFLEQNAGYGMVHTNYRTLNRQTGKIKEVIIDDVKYDSPLINTIYSGNFRCCNSSVVYRSSVIFNHVKLDDYISYQFALQDWNTWIIIANYTQFCCLPIVTTTVGIDAESITRPSEYEQIKVRFAKDKILCKYLFDLFPVNLTFCEKDWEINVNRILLNLAYLKFDYKTAKKYALQIIKMGKSTIKARMAQHWITFNLFAFGKYFRQKLNDKSFSSLGKLQMH